MNIKMKKSENGQAVILMVLAMVAMLGFTALAIDGGRLYSDRRHAQNAADAATLSGALQKANGKSALTVTTAIVNSASNNGYPEDQLLPEISAQMTDLFGKYYLVSTTVTSTIDATFAQFVYGGPLRNKVKAVAKAYPSQPALPGQAIIAMGNCTTEGGHLATVTGGGNSGSVETYNGGIFLNSPETPATECAVDPPTSTGSPGIVAHNGFLISSVGTEDYAGEPKILPNPIETSVNDGTPISDPLADLPEPTCSANGSISSGVLQPGSYGGSGQPAFTTGTLQPGIYCITGNVHLSGSSIVTGHGVVLYFINGGLDYSGNAAMQIWAPDASNCLGTTGNSSASCTYKGIAVFMARSNTSIFEVKGNGGDAVNGMIYALRATIQARGGGATAGETTVTGQIIARRVYGDGNGSFSVTYDETQTYWKSPSLSLYK